MLLKIDYRETQLIKLLQVDIVKYPHCSLDTVNLPLGDIIICDDLENELIIVERKTLNDLASSIKDGRYVEQSYRLSNSSFHNHSIFYLLEGNMNTYKDYRNITKETLLSAMTSLTYTKGFSIYRAMDILESSAWILQTAEKLSKIKEPYYYSTKDNAIACNYNSVSKRIKKNNITPENIGVIMLSQIPDVSTISAETIMQEYKTIDKLIEALKSSASLLSGVTTISKGGKPRKLSKTCISNIYKFLVE